MVILRWYIYTYYSLIRLLFANNLKTLLKIAGCSGSHQTIPTTVVGSPWYWAFVVFSFLNSLAKDKDMGKKVDLEGGLA